MTTEDRNRLNRLVSSPLERSRRRAKTSPSIRALTAPRNWPVADPLARSSGKPEPPPASRSSRTQYARSSGKRSLYMVRAQRHRLGASRRCLGGRRRPAAKRGHEIAERLVREDPVL